MKGYAMHGSIISPLKILIAAHDDAGVMGPFTHALSMALASKGELVLADVRKNGKRREELGIRAVLEQWKILPPGSQREDVENLGLKVKKIVRQGHAKKDIEKRLEKTSYDLLVIGTSGRKGIGHLFGKNLIEHLSATQRQTTLYIPEQTKPFVDPLSGKIRLKKILVPVAANPPAETSFALLQRLRSALSLQQIDVIGLHAGDSFPYITASLLEGLSFQEMKVQPDKVSITQMIAMTAEKENIDLIIMATNGRDTLSQHIVGSITEQVLKITSCPVLAVAAV
jgi:nucleotide-binding universal stress UspA family protein